MTARERYINTLTFKPTDKIPLEPGHPRRATLARWRREGLPEDMDYMDYVCGTLNIEREPVHPPHPDFFADFRLRPWFEEKVLEHKDGHFIVQDWMGAITEISDAYDYSYIRNAIDFVTRKWHKFPVEQYEDWEAMKARYDADDPARLPAGMIKDAEAINGRESVLAININGPFWQLREWMGMENLCIAFLERPEFVAEMIGFWRDFVAGMLERILPHIRVDFLAISEDMAYKAHSMISPALTRRYLQPVYECWAAIQQKYHVPVIDMDSDGYIAELIPIWIDSGIRSCSPIEVAAHNDIVHYRALYGGQMAYRGGIDKRAIAAGGAALKAEVMRVVPSLIKRGGFIPSCDHGVPHDISLNNYVEYTRLLAELTGWL